MKFLCDRCNTRYSIGDDRVRGKILKIRCKNCANVITVREGMAEPVDAAGDRRSRPATGAPGGFAPQSNKPPAALEEEWYVSIDGEQSGPFSLGEAQRWVTSKPFDAELHCWSEGFDDWLPVDKVSHFRGLRKRPAPPIGPPPIPRPMGGAPSSGRARTAAAAPTTPAEPEPKPLFAATMASLEASAPAAAPRANGSAAHPAIPGPAKKDIGLPTPIPAPRPEPALPTARAQAPSPAAKSAATLPKPGVAAKPTPASGPIVANPTPASGPMVAKPAPATAAVAKAVPALLQRTNPGVGSASAAASQSSKALADAFDQDTLDSPTMLESPAFADDLPARAAPAPMFVPAARRPPEPRPEPPSEVEDENLDIGEVSRVVKLADIAKMERSPAPRARTRGATAGAAALVGRNTGAVARFPASDVAGAAASAAVTVPAGEKIIPSESVIAAAPVRESRRGMMILLGAAGLLVAGVVVAVVVIMQNGDDEATSSTLSHSMQYDTSRPDEAPRPRNAIEAVSQSAQLDNKMVPKPIHRNPVNTIQQHPTFVEPPELPTDPTRSRIKPEEIEDMASKQGEGTKRCYMRAQKGALGIDIADIKRIDVLFTVDKDGKVTDVSLSDHGADQFGQCLIARIKGWRFRASPGGQFKFPLVFSSG